MKINFKHSLMLVLSLSFLLNSVQGQKPDATKKNWLTVYDFKATQFKAPGNEFEPYARWWWPGNDVEKKELQREINLFADNAFGGVEIQTLTLSLPESAKISKKVLSWDTPEYYENVKIVLEEARKRGLTVDMTNGSGWPAGGPFLATEDGFLNLLFADKDIIGGSRIAVAIPTIENNTEVPSRLESVLAVKILTKNGVSNFKPIQLDPTTTLVLTKNVKKDSLHWNAPVGNWKIIAFWSKPNKLTGSMVAAPKQGPVLNHLDSTKVIKNYEYLFGSRTGLQAYFGKPLRAIFTDSYEFAVDRHYSQDFLSFFKKHRGYDATPWLPANMQTAYNYATWKNPDSSPEFSFGSEDWRLKYDYNLTLSELFQEHFADASRNWTEKRGLLFRNQGYGMNLDMIAIAGHASIPETESMLGQEAMLKVMASGAHLYNRPLLSSESVVFAKRAYMTTPQKTRLAVDKLFAAGVNQIIYHGIPYRYITDETMPSGWNPFCSPGVNFSSDFGEGNTFWKFQKELNEYIGRAQYALRSGKPHADVLIYFPFMDVDGMPDNPSEILTNGSIEGVEAALPKARLSAGAKKAIAEKKEWASKIYAVINQLEENGITWDWVNDPSIQEAKLDADKQINIRGNRYQALIVADVAVIQTKTAEQINALAKKGMNFLAVGTMPTKQSSFLNWEANDKITEQQIAQAVKLKNSLHIESGNEMSGWLKTLNPTVKFADKYTFTRQAQRDLSDGSRVQFIWNKSDAWQTLSLTLNKKYTNAYWLNAETGKITAVADLKNVSYVIPPYSSIILLANTKNGIESNLLSKAEPNAYNTTEVLKVEKWDISSDTVKLVNSLLFDWRTNEQLKFSTHEGLYTSTFQLEAINPNAAYFIDLGKVYFTAEVVINGKPAGKRINAPYILNITGLLKTGENSIEVRITPGQLNGFIGEAAKGNKRFNAFKKDDGLMAAGLVGPVVLSVK
jgi:hypothetical protein